MFGKYCSKGPWGCKKIYQGVPSFGFYCIFIKKFSKKNFPGVLFSTSTSSTSPMCIHFHGQEKHFFFFLIREMDFGSDNEEDLLEQQDQQDRVTNLLKSELDELRHSRDEFVQLVVQLQRKGRTSST